MSTSKWLLAATVFSMAVPAPASAFGLRMHLYIAEQVHADAADCEISLPGGKAQRLPARVCTALIDPKNRGYFLAGALGPDVFPDLLIGQNYIHPGTDKGRQAADWLDVMMSEAQSGAEIAFVYGMMVHASTDIFAHSYVNNYAGGTFEILRKSSKDIELRHFEIEKYIDQRLDHNFDLAELQVPSRFLVETMVRTSYIPGALDIDRKLLAEAFEAPGATLAKVVAEKFKSAAPAAHMTAMWAILVIAERAAETAPCNQILATRRMTAAFERYVAAERFARGLGPEPAFNVPNAERCHRNLDAGTIEEAEAGFNRARAASIDSTTEAAFDDRKVWWDGLTSGPRQALNQSYDTYEDAVLDWKRMRAVGVLAETWKDDVALAIDEYMDASLEAAKIMVRNSEPYPPALHEQQSSVWPYQKWQNCYLPVVRGGPPAAARATCDRLTSLGTNVGLIETAVYAGLGDVRRDVVFRYLDAKQWLDRLTTRALIGLTKVLAPNLGKLVDHIHTPTRISRGDLNRSFRKARNGQLTFRCVADWIDTDLGLIPGAVDGVREDLDCTERPVSVEPATPKFNPMNFAPAVHAITLSKLALLNQDGVRSVAQAYGADPASVKTSSQTAYSIILDTARSLDGSHQWQGQSMPMPRSSGKAKNDIFLGSGYPIRHKPGTLTISFDRKIKTRLGFPYYQSAELRRIVFSALFPAPFEGQILRRQEYDAARYPFRPCSFDPFRAVPGGALPVAVCHTARD
jgi:hypothetical protein